MNKCNDCESHEINTTLCREHLNKVLSENFGLETENLILRYAKKELIEALIGLYEDCKSEHGLDEHLITEDTSSLGLAKKCLRKYKL